MPWKKEGIATAYALYILQLFENLCVEMPWKKEGIATGVGFSYSSNSMMKLKCPEKKKGLRLFFAFAMTTTSYIGWNALKKRRDCDTVPDQHNLLHGGLKCPEKKKGLRQHFSTSFKDLNIWLVEMPWKKEGIATRPLSGSDKCLPAVEMPWKKEGIATLISLLSFPYQNLSRWNALNKGRDCDRDRRVWIRSEASLLLKCPE